MVPSPAAKAPAAIFDASFLVGYCAQEPGKHAAAATALQEYGTDGWDLFAPNLLVGEVLFAPCRQIQDAKLTQLQHAQAVARFIAIANGVLPPPSGDTGLIAQAESIRGTRGCSHMSDSFYLALALELMADRQVELVTFDANWATRAAHHAIPVKVLPVVSAPPPPSPSPP